MTLQARLDRLVAGPRHSGAVMALRQGGAVTVASAGDLAADTPYFAASATKLVTTVLMDMLSREGLGLDTPFRNILTGADTERLHVQGGVDRTGEITLRQLMQHCSGLPDYFQSATPKQGLLADLTSGRDRGWSFAEAMAMARALGPVAKPGDLRRAHYSDTNFQILGQVIAAISGDSFADVARKRVFAPLGLQQTWIYADPADSRPRVLRYREGPLLIPQAMTSFQADGGMVTTALEGLALLAGIFEGALLPRGWWQALADWRPLWFPLRYGTGLMRYALPRLMTGFRKMPDMVGHSGLSGAALYFVPATGMMLSGTVNQIDKPATMYRALAEAAL